MQFTDYEWYTETFGGTAVKAASDFNALARKASAKINHLTFGRVGKMKDEDIPDEVRDCVCDLVDILQRQKMTSKPAGVESETNDGYSVSYSENAKEEQEQEIFSCVVDYLAPTHLMYRGVLPDD